ncbi:MAG TPA: glucose-1-phosphate adenylyltransferase [Burkholderiales bacterium]|nr:glucose-1-phosphate adenylyltransferase [Burkholderiales bacterium]
MSEDSIKQKSLTLLQLPRQTVALVLAGGRGNRLKQLTQRRAKPALHFGGKFRIIDFALSNCINSGINRVGVITQYTSQDLFRHLQRGWSFLRWEANEFIEALPAQQTVHAESWYRGTADAVYQNIETLREHKSSYILVLAGDHIYKMDYSRMLAFHRDSGAQCTVACTEVPRADACGFGVIKADRSGRIVEFVEKPADPPAMQGNPERALVSMGIYVFNTGFLFEQLEQDVLKSESAHDFGRNVIPEIVRRGQACAHPFRLSCVSSAPEAEPYWRDVGTVDAYWEANIDLTMPTPALDMYDTLWPIWTYQEQLPPAKFVFDSDDRRGTAIDSIVSGGCIISGSPVKRSVLFSKVRINSFCRIEGAVLLPRVEIGRHARLRNVVVDSGCSIPEGMVIGENPDDDARRFSRTERGITLVTQEMIDRVQGRG